MLIRRTRLFLYCRFATLLLLVLATQTAALADPPWEEEDIDPPGLEIGFLSWACQQNRITDSGSYDWGPFSGCPCGGSYSIEVEHFIHGVWATVSGVKDIGEENDWEGPAWDRHPVLAGVVSAGWSIIQCFDDNGSGGRVLVDECQFTAGEEYPLYACSTCSQVAVVKPQDA